MKRPQEQQLIDFIHQTEFVDWVLRPTEELNIFWKAYMAENPSEICRINKAKQLIEGLIPNEKSLCEAEVEMLWSKIKESDSSRKRNLIQIKGWSIAASILVLIGLSGWFLSDHTFNKTEEIDYHSVAVKAKPGNEVRLILADHSEKIFSNKEVDIKYNKDGNIETNSEKKAQTETVNQNNNIELTNQLVVPFGRKSKVELADGTKLWLNSGSRAIYPVVFGKDKREIYIEGEGYLEVAHDASRPFYVVTDKMRVRVLGTKFNVSAYEEDATISVVLVEGSIEASSGSQKVLLKPNQLLSYQKSTHETTISPANVLEHVSWIDGWMLCGKEKLSSIFTKLSRYYDIRIDITDPKLENMTLTGKLDLKNNCEDVIKVICATAPLKYELNSNQITIGLVEK